MIRLTAEDKKMLLHFARKTLKSAFDQSEFDPLRESYPEHLDENGASFVTLTKADRLRGCIGTLSAYQPLVQDVCEHAMAAAFHDPRFPPLTADELSLINIEISYLTPPEDFKYETPEDLTQKLQPNIHGVILQDGYRKATYLPQVWEQLPEPVDFLSSLCRKMGANGDLWRNKHLTVQVYYAIHFGEVE